MDLTPGTAIRDIAVDTVFVGSCTNGRIEDLRAAAEVLRGRQVADRITMLVVPGSAQVREQAEDEGLDRIFTEAGAQWRGAGCSMCLGMNPDRLAAGSAQRVHLQPELRGTSGRRRPYPPGITGGCRGHRGGRQAGRSGRPVEQREGGSQMDKFTVHTGTGLPLRRSNVDTDQIIPAEFLKRITRTGFDDALFASWRTDPDFVLNDRRFARASVLVAGTEFGIGSSREHAVWALRDYGFKVVLSSRFGDIFRGNSLKNGLLTVLVDQAVIEELWALIESEPATEITVDLERLELRFADRTIGFELAEDSRQRLLQGADDITLTLRHAEQIDEYERSIPGYRPNTLAG